MERVIIELIFCWILIMLVLIAFVYSIGELNKRYDKSYNKSMKQIYMLRQCSNNRDYALLRYLDTTPITLEDCNVLHQNEKIYARITSQENGFYVVDLGSIEFQYVNAEEFFKSWEFYDEDLMGGSYDIS